jgi:hypothetical protein
LDNPLHVILNNSKLAYRIYVILIANKELIKKMRMGRIWVENPSGEGRAHKAEGRLRETWEGTCVKSKYSGVKHDLDSIISPVDSSP